MTQALVIPAAGAAPVCVKTAEPDGTVVELVAAELLPLDLQVAAGALPSLTVRDLRAGQVAVGRTADDVLVSVQAGRIGGGLGAPFGTFATRFAVAGAAVAPIPAGLDPLVAAAGVSSVLAARLALQAAGAESGDVVLVVGASGAVGSAAVALAAARGCQVVRLTRDDPAGTLAASEPADVIIDCAAGWQLGDVVRAAAPRARHVIVGYVGDGLVSFPLPLLLVAEHRLIGLNVYRVPESEFTAAHAGALADLAAGTVEIPAARLEAVPLAAAAQAYDGRRRVLLVP